MCRSPVTFGGGTQMTKLSARRAPAPAAYSPSSSQACCQRASTPSGRYSDSTAGKSTEGHVRGLRHTSPVDAVDTRTLSAGDVRLWLLVVATAVVASERWGVAGAVAAALLATLVGAAASDRAPAFTSAAALATAGAAAIHFAVATPHVREWWGFGAFFVAAGWAQLGWSALAPRRGDQRLLWVGLAGNLVV